MLIKKADLYKICQLSSSNIPDTGSYIQAAVLVIFVNRDDKTHVVYIRRTQHLSHHGGDIAFPGGKIEHTDTSSFDAAARETYEEIGITRKQFHYIGCMGAFQTLTSRFDVRAHLVWTDTPVIYNRNHYEVAEILEIPLITIYRQFNQNMDLRDTSQLLNLSFFLPSDGKHRHILWGLSARITHHFCLGISKLSTLK